VHGFEALGGVAQLEEEAPLDRFDSKERLVATLCAGDHDAAAQLLKRRLNAEALDSIVGEALRELGERWETGEVGVEIEHRASYIVAEILDSHRPTDRKLDGPLAILAAPPGEQHELPLRMLRIILEQNGWRTSFLGANVPWQSTAAAIASDSPRLVAMSARSSDPFESAHFAKVGTSCRQRRIDLVIGGNWVRGRSTGTSSAIRFRSLRSFERWLRSESD
jgi:methanogenic corrinoid protein MtbC1